MRARYTWLPHTADIKVRAEGGTVAEAYVQAALAATEAIGGGRRVRALQRRALRVSGRDAEARLYAFLEELIVLADTEGFLVASVPALRIEGSDIEAVIAGETPKRYARDSKVKAVTYHEMSVREEHGRWIAEFVLDV